MNVPGHLLEHILLFGRALHSHGMDVNSHQLVTLLRALDHVQISNKTDFYLACRCILVHRQSDYITFDQIFNQFWGNPTEGGIPLNLPHTPAPRRIDRLPGFQTGAQDSESTSDQSQGEDPSVEDLAIKTYSPDEILRHKDFSKLNADEVHEIRKLIRDLFQRISIRKTRRWKFPGHKRDELRRTLRRSLQYGGNIFEWIRLDPKMKPRPIVLLADVSGSMERYTQVLLYFLLELAASSKPVEAFIFSTRLTRITPYMQAANFELSLDEISRRVPDWSGGTRIGEAIKIFNYRWARRVLGSSAVVMLISDGWDRGDTQILSREIARLQRSCHRLIWLNPLLGIPAYEPLTRGIRAALPFIDDHLPVHNLVSLEELAHHLGDIPAWRDLRPQAREITQPSTSA